MPKMKKILCLHVCLVAWCIHPVFASAGRSVAVPEREDERAASRKKADKKTKIHVGV